MATSNRLPVEQIIKQGFSDLDIADKRGGTAIQRLAAGIMGKFLMTDFTEPVDVRAFVTYDDAKQSAARSIVVKEICGEPPMTDSDNRWEQHHMSLVAKYNARKAAVARALKFASILLQENVEWKAFDQSKGEFVLPMELLCGNDQEPAYSSKNKHPMCILNGEPWYVHRMDKGGKAVPVRVKASVAQVMNAYESRNAKRTNASNAPRTRTAGAVTAAKPETVVAIVRELCLTWLGGPAEGIGNDDLARLQRIRDDADRSLQELNRRRQAIAKGADPNKVNIGAEVVFGAADKAAWPSEAKPTTERSEATSTANNTAKTSEPAKSNNTGKAASSKSAAGDKPKTATKTKAA